MNIHITHSQVNDKYWNNKCKNDKNLLKIFTVFLFTSHNSIHLTIHTISVTLNLKIHIPHSQVKAKFWNNKYKNDKNLLKTFFLILFTSHNSIQLTIHTISVTQYLVVLILSTEDEQYFSS